MNPQLHSYTALVQQYHPLLSRYANFIIRDRQQANDIAGKALTQLWSCRNNIAASHQVRPFLKNTARILCHTWLQQQVLQGSAVDDCLQIKKQHDTSDPIFPEDGLG